MNNAKKRTGISKMRIIKGTLKSTIIAPAPVARSMSHILDPKISPTAIPNDPLLIAVKSATSSGRLVPNPTNKIPITFSGMANSFEIS